MAGRSQSGPGRAALMHLVRIGYRTINLEYLIEAADSELGAPPNEAPPGKVRVSVYPGKVFDVGGEAARQLRLHLDDNLKPLPPTGGDTTVQTRPRRGVKAGSVSSPKPTDE